MAHAEAGSQEGIGNLSTGQLLHVLNQNITSLAGIPDWKGPHGGIRTIDNASNPDSYDDIGRYQAGQDKPTQIEGAASLKANDVLSLKGRGNESPRAYHVVVEQARRYQFAFGETNLASLARIAVGMVSIAADREGSTIRAHIVADREKPALITPEIGSAVSYLKGYERKANEFKLNRRPDGKALTEALNSLKADSTNFDPSTDIAVVISDFIGGEKVDDNDRLNGFTWAKPLRWLNTMMQDRLLVVQLFTPSQERWPNAQVVDIDGATAVFDSGEQLEEAAIYNERGSSKSRLIDESLHGTRHLKLSATDKKPHINLAKFMFQVRR